MLVNICRDVKVSPLNTDYYLQEEIYGIVDQKADQSKPLRDIDEAYCGTLARSFCSYNLDHARGMKAVYFSSTVNPEGSTYVTAVHNVDARKVLKYGYYLVILDNHHRRRSFKSVRDRDAAEYAAKPLRMRFACQADGKSFMLAEAIKLS